MLNLFGCEQSSVSLTRYIIGETRWKKFDKLKVSMKKGPHGKFFLKKKSRSLKLIGFAQ